MQPIVTSGSGGEAELFGAQQRGDGDVAAGSQFAVGLHADAAAQVVHHQHLLGFRQTQLPGRARMLDGSKRRGARAAIVSADQNHVGMSLGHARRHRAHAHFGDQLHGNARLRIDVLQIVNQLRQIFDGINIVMRRRRNQTHARHRMAHARDHFIHFVTGQLAAFTGLRALRHLDLQIVGVHQIMRGDAEPSGRHLFDGTAPGIAVSVGNEARFVFPALAGIGAPAHAIHSDGQRLVGLFRNGSEGHGAGGEALDDFAGRLDILNGNRLAFLELEQAPQRAQLAAFGVDRSAYSWKVAKLRCRTACCSLLMVVGFSR